MFTNLISVLEASDAHLVASVVSSREHGPVSRDEQHRTEPWQQHAVIISRLLRGCINKRELVSVLLDGIATPPECSLSDTVRRLTNQGLDSLAVVSVSSLNSKTNDLLQVADLVAGAVRHERVRDRGAPRTHKGRVAMRLANAFDCPGLADMRTGRVNIYTYRPPVRRARRSTGLRVVKPSPPHAG
ncbi:MAG: DUF3800 domain-containing protein [Actinomycetia bacterium]|nr:DUF3800 domain-containing protein [Actinomycetes bacterium]